MRKLIGILGLAMAALLSLSACGGGGGSPGTTAEQYSITLRADKTSLPININYQPPGTGVYAPYTTTLYVEGREGGRTIPNGTDIFSCNVSGGLDTGALYYLDGDSAHEDTNGNPLAYRSIVLPSNAGGASFHFHAYDQAGTARITCSVQDPRDSQMYSAYVDITVGGATGKPSSMELIAEAPDYLGTQGNMFNLRTSIGVQAFLWDDANQPVPNPSAPNLQVSIKAMGDAWLGSRLQSGMQSGANIQVSTVAGVAYFTLSSGPSKGPILLELTADRYDNNVSNGIQDPVVQYAVVTAVDVMGPLAVTSATLDATNGQMFMAALEATGGLPPYTWAIQSGSLPTGMSLDPTFGILQGTVSATPGTYLATVQATDALGNMAVGTVTITVTGDLPPPPPAPLHITSMSASGQATQPFSYILSASGGTPPLTWTAVGTPIPGLTLNSVGVLSGTPTAAGTYLYAVSVKDSSNPALTATANITITIAP